MANKMSYRLALDLGSSSLGWAMIRLTADGQPCAVIRAGSRIFPDGRSPKDGSSLAVSRREARSMRRRRDRLLKRKAKMMRALITHGFFPIDEAERKAFEQMDPYSLRARGLDEALEPGEFARALFHLTQRRGFLSNRKTDKKENDSGALKAAIKRVRETFSDNGSRTIGEWLHKRMVSGETVRARYREQRLVTSEGKSRIDKSYDLYVDRAMIEAEFDLLWTKQSEFNPHLFNDAVRAELKDILLFQRKLRAVRPGRCTFFPEHERAPLALPSVQRFRIYQEVNHLRILQPDLREQTLTLTQRDALFNALECNYKRTFPQIRKLIGAEGAAQFNLEDPKRQELKGNSSTAILSKTDYFGAAWFGFDEVLQDEIVLQLLNEDSEAQLIQWLQEKTCVDEAHAEAIANVSLPEGYGSLSLEAVRRILPELKRSVISYDKAVTTAGFEHHSKLSDLADGEFLPALPYYGSALQRHVGFGTNDPKDSEEKCFGKIANPTVHIGLNQVRLLVNALISRYGHPSEVIVEVARELKQSKLQREEENKRQTENQSRNARFRRDIAEALGMSVERVKQADMHKMILWTELSHDVADRRCPYSGVQISLSMLLSDEVEIEHILPFSQTLDDSLNNKTVAMRRANRVKGNQTPWQAFGKQAVTGFEYAEILLRAEQMPRSKRYRFAEDGYERWLKEDKDFLARALNDTRYLSKIAREYVSLICPRTRVIPGQMTAMLRAKFGLNNVLSLSGEKNRNDHRHHAVDACVIGVTDQGMLMRFAQASASAREKQLDRLVETMPLPWPTYREHVERAVGHIWVSHKPDHGHEGAMHNDTAYGLLGNGRVRFHKVVDGRRQQIEVALKVIEFSGPMGLSRHGVLPDGQPKPYKGYKGDSNYCIEIVRNESGQWESEIITTFVAYQIVRESGLARLRDPERALSGKSLVMRLMINDMVRLEVNDRLETMRIATISGNGQIFMAAHQEANVDARNRAKDDAFGYVSKRAGSLMKAKGRRITVTAIGDLRDPGFKA